MSVPPNVLGNTQDREDLFIVFEDFIVKEGRTKLAKVNWKKTGPSVPPISMAHLPAPAVEDTATKRPQSNTRLQGASALMGKAGRNWGK